MNTEIEHHLTVFRPGTEPRGMARCQFSLPRDGNWIAILTYPIPGYPWRHCRTKMIQGCVAPDLVQALFAEVQALPIQAPEDCLTGEALWADQTEKANAITRDRATNTLCYTFEIKDESGATHFSMKENSLALMNSLVYRTMADLIRAYERLESK